MTGEVHREPIFSYTAGGMKELLELKQLSFKYPDYPGLEFPQLFSNINLTLNKGDFRIVLGKPESGKTTLSRIITGLIPRYTGGVLTGSILLNGKTTAELKPYELIEQAGTVFQNPDEQIITTRCDTEIAFPMESLGWERTIMTKRIDAALHDTDISRLKTRNPATLSGGEKKKLLIASLFALDPDVWILDETLEELDPASVQMILTQILQKEKTVLLLASKNPKIPENIQALYSVFSEGELFHRENLPEHSYQELLEQEGLVIPGNSTSFSLPVTLKKENKNGELLLQIRNVRYSYEGNREFSLTIDNLSLHKGEILSIVGENGSGKSTLGKILSGLIQPSSGDISIRNGEYMQSATAQALNAFTGFLFQNPDSQIFLPTVKEELSFNLDLDEHVLSDTIQLFSLPGKDVPPALMSYGARKRLQGAVYYLLAKRLYIIDEADSGLSINDYSNIISLLKKKNAALIIITHNMELSRFFSDRTYIMERGAIIKTIEKNQFSRVQTYFDTIKGNQ